MQYIRLFVTTLMLTLAIGLAADDVQNLKKQQKQLQQEMEDTNKMLQQTKRNETATLNKLELLNRNIKTQQRLLSSLDNEIQALNREMNKLSGRRDELQDELEKRKSEYAELVRESHYNRMQQSPLLFLLSSDSFYRMLRRMRYLQEFASFRRREVERIEQLQHEIDEQNQMLDHNRSEKESTLKKQKREQENLNRDKKKQDAMLAELKKKDKDLTAQLKKQQKKAADLNKKIEQLVAAEANRQNKDKLTREEELVAGGFKANRGKLPWPIEKGFISGHFGKHQHPVYEHVTIDNKGIYLQTTQGARARAVYDGTVTSTFLMNGTYAVIIQHGNYRSVYAGLQSLQVKQGDNVKAKQNIGIIYSDSEQDNKTELYFQIYEDKEIKNPELWLTK